jgi:hypothetical protein
VCAKLFGPFPAMQIKSVSLSTLTEHEIKEQFVKPFELEFEFLV